MEGRKKTLKEFCESLLKEFKKLPAPELDITLITEDTTKIPDPNVRKAQEDKQRNELLKYVGDNTEYDDLVKLLEKHTLDKEANEDTLIVFSDYLKNRWQDNENKLLLAGRNGHDLDYTISYKLRISRACLLLAKKLGEYLPENSQPQHPYVFLMPSLKHNPEYTKDKKKLFQLQLWEIFFNDMDLPSWIVQLFEELAKHLQKTLKSDSTLSNEYAPSFMRSNHLKISYLRMQSHSKEAAEYYHALVHDSSEEEKAKKCKAFHDAIAGLDHEGKPKEYCVTATYGSHGIRNLARYLLRRCPDKIQFAQALADVKHLQLRYFKLFFSAVSSEDLCKLMLDVKIERGTKKEEEHEAAILDEAMRRLADPSQHARIGHLNTKELCAYTMCLLPIYSRFRLSEDKPDHTSKASSWTAGIWKGAPSKEDKQKLFNVFWDFLVTVGEGENNPKTKQPYHLTKEDLKTYIEYKFTSKEATECFDGLTVQPWGSYVGYTNNLTKIVDFFSEAGKKAIKNDTPANTLQYVK